MCRAPEIDTALGATNRRWDGEVLEEPRYSEELRDRLLEESETNHYRKIAPSARVDWVGCNHAHSRVGCVGWPSRFETEQLSAISGLCGSIYSEAVELPHSRLVLTLVLCIQASVRTLGPCLFGNTDA